MRELYEQRGITARFGAKPSRVHATAPPRRAARRRGPVAGELELADGKREPFDLLIVIPAHTAAAFLRESGLLGPERLGAGRSRHARDRVRRHLGDRRRLACRARQWRHAAEGGRARPRRGRDGGGLIAARLLGTGAATPFDGRGGCFETAHGEAAYAEGDFFAEPGPVVTLTPPSRAALAKKEEFAREWGRWY